ncbi:hypothetical protein GLYMA_17G045700v4 [Glycine max]|nr:hypothetical protein GLYMA_17G045700v4 [Glycine max]KAH1116767.1 hypothetical protein GYH30_046245 [Glycine max]
MRIRMSFPHVLLRQLLLLLRCQPWLLPPPPQLTRDIYYIGPENLI